MTHQPRVVTLLTDFGLRDHYVAAIKGVMLGVNPDIVFVDISHLIPPHDVYTAAYVLGQAYDHFALGTIHMAVVDPGVGTDRKILAVSAGGRFFIAPDNGVLSFVFNREDGFECYEVTEEHYYRRPVSTTFHGRDIMAPVAAWISRDVPLKQFGVEYTQPVRLKIPSVTRVRDALVQGAVLAIDHFGNLITNLPPSEVPAYYGDPARKCKMVAGKREITSFCRTFSEGTPGELFVIPGSSGYLEIAMRNQSAAAELHLAPGAPVGLIFS